VELRRLKDSERRAAKAEQKLSISVIKDLLIVAFSLSVSELVRSQSIEAKEILGILSAVILVALVLTLVRTYR
jgi:Kef-type K+ transport system membrane component KefB